MYVPLPVRTYAGLNGWVRLRVRRESLVVDCAEWVRKQNECEKLTLDTLGALSFLVVGSKAFEQINFSAAVKIGKTKESMIHVMEDCVTAV